MALTVKATQLVHGTDWDQTTIAEIEIDELDVQISEMEKLKAKAEHYKLLAEEQQARVIDLMEARAEKTHISALDGGRQATVVYGETVEYDLDELAARLDPDQLEAITVLKVDRRRLESAVLGGRVPALLVAEHAVVKPRKPFVKISEHRESEPEG